MHSSQGHRSIYTCIIGLGRKSFRPLSSQQEYQRSLCLWIDGRISPKTSDLQVSLLYSQPCNVRVHFKRTSSSALPLRSTSLMPFHGQPIQYLRGRLMLNLASLGTKTVLLASQRTAHKGAWRGQFPCVISSLTPNPLCSTLARQFGTHGKGGGGGGGVTPSGGGGSTGTFNTNSYQFMNNSRNIFGVPDG